MADRGLTIRAPDRPGTSWQKAELQIAALLCVAIILGGGGVAYAMNNLTVQLVALLIMALNLNAILHFWNNAPLSLKLLTGLSVALPLLQLIPLPPPVWQELPGRALVLETLNAAQIRPGWRPLSLDPARTFVAALGLIVPFAILSIGWSLPMRSIARLGWVIVALGLASFLWGIPQVLSNGAAAIPYPENPMPGVMFGSFANRNSTGLFFVACFSLVTGLRIPFRPDWSGPLTAVAAILFLVAIVLTQSRTAIALGGMTALLFAFRWLIRRPAGHRFALAQLFSTRRRVVVAAGALLAVAAAGIAIVPGSRVETAIDRFTLAEDTRLAIWEDAAFSAQRFWPVGAGMGTFDEVFQIDESLEHLSPRKAGRAHNDYIELAIEGGAASLAIVLGWIMLIGFLALRARWAADRDTAQVGALILLAISLQSITDYPLRNQAMLALAALALLMVARAASDQSGRRE